MKLLPILFLALLSVLYAAEEQSELFCNSTFPPFASRGKHCRQRKVDSEKYCCYVKGKVRDNPYVNYLDGCMSLYKREVDNDAIDEFMANMKKAGYVISVDCISSYLTFSSILLLIILI